MGFAVLPASIPDIKEIYDVYFTTFDGDLVTQVLFPWDVHNAEFREGHTKHTLEYWQKDTSQYTYKCIETETGKIVGMSLWDFHWRERTPEDRKLPTVDWLQGAQKERAQEFISVFWQKKEDVVGARKHAYCHVVAVLPEFQRRGIGALLTKAGIDIAEQLQIPVYLEATDRAVRLYDKLGFEKLDSGVVLAPSVVGTGEIVEAPVMIRLPSAGTVRLADWLLHSDS